MQLTNLDQLKMTRSRFLKLSLLGAGSVLLWSPFSDKASQFSSADELPAHLDALLENHSFSHVERLSQGEYDTLTPDADTLYVIIT
jgi:hypothetical protein